MLRYLLIRLTWMIPTMGAVSLLAFFISHRSPIDPIATACDDPLGVSDFRRYTRCREAAIREYHLDKPAFYVSLTDWADPGDLYLIVQPQERQAAERMLFELGDWERVEQWRVAVADFQQRNDTFRPDTSGLPEATKIQILTQLREAQYRVPDLSRKGKPASLQITLDILAGMYGSTQALQPLAAARDQLDKLLVELQAAPSRWRCYLPWLHWQGFDNQYHIWLTGVLTRLDFGKRIEKGAEISREIGNLFWTTAMMALLSTIFVFVIGIPLGMWAAIKRDTWIDRALAVVLFSFRALPEFWLATVLLMIFANPDIAWLNWFKSSVNVSHPNPVDNVLKYVLPLVAYTYGSLAIVSRTVRVSLLDTFHEDYIQTARAKGLSERVVLFKHALRNALLPMVTLLGGLLPALLSGAVVLETVFEIPGMGREIFSAMTQNDMPFLLAIFTLMGFLTMLGYLIADLLYAWLDPRIRFGNKD